MKSFNLTNFDRLNLEIVIGGVTYSDEYFTLQGLQSYSRGSNNSTSAEVDIEGTLEDFVRLKNANTVLVNIITGTGTEPFLTLFAKHPMSYDGKFITVQLDTTPQAKYISHTTVDGHALPYSFGKPYVKPVLVSEKVVGVVTESMYALSIANLNTIFEAYLSSHVAQSEASVFGLGKDNLQNLSSVLDFYAIIQDFQKQVPDKAALLEDLYSMASWRGDSGHNAGLPPPLSLYSVIQSYAYSPNRAIDSQHGVSDSGVYRNILTGDVGNLLSLQHYYLNLCNALLEVPTVLKIDLGDFVGETTLKIQGLDVTGDYLDGVFTITSRSARPVTWSFQPHSDNHSIVVDADLSDEDLIGKYVKIQTVSSYPFGLTHSFVGSVEVLGQVGNVLELASIPYENKSRGSGSGGQYYHTQTTASGLMRQGVILNISDTLEGSRFEGDPALVSGNYHWADVTRIDAPAYYKEVDDGEGNIEHEMVYYVEYSSKTGSVTSGTTALGDSTAIDTYATGFNGEGFTWGVTVGDQIELDSDYKDIYVVDYRPNIAVLEVKAKVGDYYVVVPAHLYNVVSEYEYAGLTVTAINVPKDLSLRDLSNDIVVQVDTGEYTVGEILTPLCTALDKTYSEVGTFTSAPNFTVYGVTNILDVIVDVTEQSNGAYVFGTGSIIAKHLEAEPATINQVLDVDSMAGFKLLTTDAVNIVSDTTFSWESLRYLDEQITVVLADPPESLQHNTKKEVTIFDDAAQSLIFAKWFVHRQGRDWLRVTVTGFMVSLHLEYLDVVEVAIEGASAKGEVQTVSYDSDTGAVVIEVLLETEDQSLWTVGTDLVVDGYVPNIGYENPTLPPNILRAH